MRRFVIVGVLAGVAALGCRAPAMAPPRAAATLPVESVGPRRVLDERLRRLWPDDPSGPAWFVDHGYRVAVRQAGDFVAIRAPITTLAPDLSMTATFRKVGGPPGGGYGLIVRRQPIGAGDGVDQHGQFIVAAAGDRGEFGVWRRDGQRWLDLVPWTPSTAVQPGANSNALAARVARGRLAFSINGVQVADVPVGLQAGGVGVFVGGDLNEVVVQDLVVDEIHTATAVPTPEPAMLLSSQEQEVAEASARLSALSVASRSEPPTSDGAWRSQATDSLAALQRVGQEVEFEFGGGQANAAQVGRVRDLMGSIAEDVSVIAYSFSDGFDSPRSPVNNKQTLLEVSGRLKSAAQKAELVRAELRSLREGVDGGKGFAR